MLQVVYKPPLSSQIFLSIPSVIVLLIKMNSCSLEVQAPPQTGINSSLYPRTWNTWNEALGVDMPDISKIGMSLLHTTVAWGALKIDASTHVQQIPPEFAMASLSVEGMSPCSQGWTPVLRTLFSGLTLHQPLLCSSHSSQCWGIFSSPLIK